jgi:ribosomal protein S18 acetylase RimI-like enzyme
VRDLEICVATSLTPSLVRQVRDLEGRCYEPEGLKGQVYLSTELNFDRDIPAFFLGYEQGRLAAFLGLFFPEREEAEVTAFTDPVWRRRGFFTALLHRAGQVCRENGIPSILLETDEQSQTAKKVLEHLPDARYQFSEYRMQLSAESQLAPTANTQLMEVRPQHRDVYHGVALKALELDEGAEGYLQAVFQNPLRHGYLLYWQGMPVGVFHINCEGGESCIYGLGLLPQYRGKGLGGPLVQRAALEARRFQQPVVLEVDSENGAALHLYRKSGFEVVRQINYTHIPAASLCG